MDPDRVKELLAEGIKHIEFCIELYNIQLSEGRYFLHEHPWSASSWHLPCISELLKDEKILVAKGNTIADDKAALKATGWMTNSKFILDELAVLCSSDGKCSPEKLCHPILKGLRKQLNKDKIMFEGELGTVCEDLVEKEFFQELSKSEVFYDEISKKQLTPPNGASRPR